MRRYGCIALMLITLSKWWISPRFIGWNRVQRPSLTLTRVDTGVRRDSLLKGTTITYSVASSGCPKWNLCRPSVVKAMGSGRGDQPLTITHWRCSIPGSSMSSQVLIKLSWKCREVTSSGYGRHPVCQRNGSTVRYSRTCLLLHPEAHQVWRILDPFHITNHCVLLQGHCRTDS